MKKNKVEYNLIGKEKHRLYQFDLMLSKVYKKNKLYSMLDDGRVFTLLSCLSNFIINNVQPVNIAEIGVRDGGTCEIIVNYLDQFKIKSNVSAFDTFVGHLNINQNEDNLTSHFKGKFINKEFKLTQKIFKKLKINIIQGDVQSTLNPNDFMNFFDFIHLDVDLYEPTSYVLNNLNLILKKSGICLVDDYKKITTPGIKKSIDNFIIKHKNFLFFEFPYNQIILVKLF